MKPSSPAPSTARRLVAALLLAHLLAVLVLAASPRLHAWLHPDEADDDGDCAVVLLLHGTTGGAALPPLPIAAPVTLAIECVAMPGPAEFVPTVFARGQVLEHAPPVVA